MHRRSIAFILTALLLLLPWLCRAEEEAENLNLQGTWTFAGGRLSPRGDSVNDNDPESRRTLKQGKTFRIRFNGDTEPATLGLIWYTKPYGAQIERLDGTGALLGADTVSGEYVSVISLEPDTREIVVRAAQAALEIAEADVFGPGAPPEPYHVFAPLPEKLDYMVIAAHPDDDVLFLGAVVPYLGGEEGLIGTIVYMTKPTLHGRNIEALNGAWTMGLRYTPIFGTMKDVLVRSWERLYHFVNREDTVRYLVRLIRQYRPVLLFTHEPEGESGHLEHQFISEAVLEAVRKAQDPEYDNWSTDLYGPWQVSKLYWHDYQQTPERLLFDPDAPLASFGGKTAYEICCEAFKKHRSQQGRVYAVHRYGEHRNSFNMFGLAYAAGEETAELRAGIDPAMFSDYVPPTPSPMPTGVPVSTPTGVPSPAPTSVPAQTDVPAATAVPAPVPSPAPDDPSAPEEPLLAAPAICAIACLLLLGGLGARYWLRKWRQMQSGR